MNWAKRLVKDTVSVNQKGLLSGTVRIDNVEMDFGGLEPPDGMTLDEYMESMSELVDEMEGEE